MKTGNAVMSTATIAGFTAKIDRLLEDKRTKKVRSARPDLPVLTALSGTYRRMSGGLLPVIDQAAQIVSARHGWHRARQTITPPPDDGHVVAMKWPALAGILRGANYRLESSSKNGSLRASG